MKKFQEKITRKILQDTNKNKTLKKKRNNNYLVLNVFSSKKMTQ